MLIISFGFFEDKNHNSYMVNTLDIRNIKVLIRVCWLSKILNKSKQDRS